MTKKRGRKRVLSDDQVKELRECYADRDDRRSISQLARRFNVSPVTADNCIMKRGAYKESAPASYSIEVLCYDYSGAPSPTLGRYVWKKLRSTYGAPYVYKTRREAVDMAEMCYSGSPAETVRIVVN